MSVRVQQLRCLLIAVLILSLGTMFSPVVAASEASPEMRVDFELIGADGTVVSDEDFRGSYLLLAFGFTHCPHICPMMAANMGRALKMTDQKAAGVFISVDSERDTPALTDAYAKKFDVRMIGLSGSYAQLVAAAKNLKVTFVVTKSDAAYTVQHTPDIYLIGPDGAVIEVFPLNASAKRMAEAMR